MGVVNDRSLLKHLVLIPANDLSEVTYRRVRQVFSCEGVVNRGVFVGVDHFRVVVVYRFVNASYNRHVSFDVMSCVVLQVRDDRVIRVVFVDRA